MTDNNINTSDVAPCQNSVKNASQGAAKIKTLAKTPLEWLNDLTVCLTETRLQATQAAVLSTIARFPGCGSGPIAFHTGISSQRVVAMLRHLLQKGHIACTKYSHNPAGHAAMAPRHGRCFTLTDFGKQTVAHMVKHLHYRAK